MSTRTLVRLAAAAAGVLVLAGCGGIKPGVAVEVDGASLSMRQLDDRSADYCVITGAGGQDPASGQGAAATGDARRAVASSFIVARLAERAARAEDVTVPPSRSQIAPAQLAAARQALGADTVARVRGLLDEQARTSALVAALGAKDTGFDYAGSTDAQVQAAEQQLLQAGSAQLQKALGEADITVDPRIGLDTSSLQPTGRTGSLSVAVSRLPNNLPAGQTCS
ncbi:hypothetical protein [Solicola sp. PLA-1-18]|uniref:hypothetical protein n=1 Tax=Solicola sp. PLA-1-18 TaxID=3380532 RepID=UPI003B7D5F2A